MLTRSSILANGIEALTEVDAVGDLSDNQMGGAWFREQAAGVLRGLRIPEDHVQSLEAWLTRIYLPKNDEDGAEALQDLNALCNGKDSATCDTLCSLVTAALYDQGDEQLQRAIEREEEE
jgi:hypothetical protein